MQQAREAVEHCKFNKEQNNYTPSDIKENATIGKKITNYHRGLAGETDRETCQSLHSNLYDIASQGTAPRRIHLQKEDDVQSTISDVRVIILCYFI